MNVWITRDEAEGGPLCSALRTRGLVAVLEPVISRRVRGDAFDEIEQLEGDDWLVLTSVFAIESIADDARALEVARRAKVAVVGDGSRCAAEVVGMRVALVGESEGAGGLFARLREKVTAGRVFYPRSSRATVPGNWGEVKVSSPVLYDTTVRAFDRSVVDRIDVVAVTSPSSVEAVGRVDRSFASIGPTTSGALRAMGIEPWVEAGAASFESLAEAIANR